MSVRSKPTAEYAKRGLAAFRHGSPARHSELLSIGIRIVELSCGAEARKSIAAPPLRSLNTNAPMTPLNVPV